MNSDLELVKTYLKKGAVTEFSKMDHAVNVVVINNHKDVPRLFHERKLLKEEEYAMLMAAQAGHIKLCKLCYEMGPKIIKHVMDFTA